MQAIKGSELCPELRKMIDLAHVRVPLDTTSFTSKCVEAGWQELNARVLRNPLKRSRRSPDSPPVVKVCRNASCTSMDTCADEGDAASALVELRGTVE